MTVTLPPDVWVPVPVRARHIIVGDLIAGSDNAVWLVTESRPAAGTWSLNLYGHGLVYPDPDEAIPVLVPVTERDAVELTRDQLGARLVERRTERE